MALSKVKGNMYPWVTHMHTHLRGECPHRCRYCYVRRMEERFGKGTYSGPLRLDYAELDVRYGSGKKIFVEHCNDLFADAVPADWISAVLEHCRAWPGNEYVFQTKNPGRVFDFRALLPERRMIGVTIETARRLNGGRVISSAPPARTRADDAQSLRVVGERVFVSVEPMLAGDVFDLAEMVWQIRPEFVSLGADSKRAGMNEPSPESAREFVRLVRSAGIDLRIKDNFGRLL